MKRAIVFLLAIMCAGTVLGQNKDKEVAVMKPYVMGGATVSENDKLIMVGAIEEAFTKINGYKVFSRTSQKLIDAEMAFQRSGKVADEQIKAVGEQAGVAYICTFTLAIEGSELVIKSNIIDVVTAEVINSKTVVCLDRTKRADVIEKCESLPYKLLNVNQGSSSSSSSSSNSNSGSRHPAEPEMIFVQGGTFYMGCSSEQGSDCYDNESPLHQVTVSNFNIGKYEVTQGQWKAIMGNNPSYFKNGDNYPVENVSWQEVQEFISRLNAATGKHYRLPTEAEWEYAARGGNKSQNYKYSGSNNLNNVAWFKDNSGSTTHIVGTKMPNELGIYDMSGNVWEWCSDWYGTYSSAMQRDPMGASSGSNRGYRGGSWRGTAPYCRVADRAYNSPSNRCNALGFRVVLP